MVPSIHKLLTSTFTTLVSVADVLIASIVVCVCPERIVHLSLTAAAVAFCVNVAICDVESTAIVK